MSRDLFTPMIPAAPTYATVGNVASAQILAANPKRTGLILSNTHATQTVSLGLGAAAVSGSGITIMAGKTFFMTQYNLFKGAVNALASGAGTNLGIIELTE